MQPSIRCIAAITICSLVPCAFAQQAGVMTITDANAPVPGMTVVTRQTVSMPHAGSTTGDVPQMPGFPVQMGTHPNFAPTRGLLFVNLDADDELEIVTSGTDARLYAWKHTGENVPGFPVVLNNMAQYAPSVADMDGDGDMEIVQFTRYLTSGGRVYVIDHQGQVLPGWPVSVNNNNIEGCPTLYDLDGDNVMEIIAAERRYPLGYVHVFELDGSEWGGNWPVEMDHVPTCTASVADVDHDGSPEIFYMSYNSMYLIDVDGTIAPGWPRGIAGANFSYQSAALADLDGDEDMEIVVGAHRDAAGCYVFHHDGTGYPGWPKLLGTWTYCAPTVTDLEGDGVLEIIDGRAGVFSGQSSAFWAWTSSGQQKAGFPYSVSHGGGSEGPLTTADIDGDGVLEIFADHNVMISGQGFLFGVDAQGNDLPGFPLRPQGFTYLNGATIGDVDNDGDFELGVLSRYDGGVDVNLYDLPDLTEKTNRDWPIYHARNSRGGEYNPASGGGCTRDPAWQCDGDVDGDAQVNPVDSGLVQAAFGSVDAQDLCNYDMDCDGQINPVDSGIVQSLFGTCDAPRNVCP
jgi:hypothetical protein